MVEIICKECKKGFEVQKYREKTAKFCSISCRAKWDSRNRRGKNHHNFNESNQINLICLYCEKEYPSKLWKKDRSKFCCKKCQYEWSSENLIKEERYNYKGNSSKRKKEGYFNSKYREWRMKIFLRDNFVCQSCGERGYIEAHHIKSWAKYPELRFELNNGITLCLKCHKDLHKVGGENR